jgi:hypothetical protein
VRFQTCLLNQSEVLTKEAAELLEAFFANGPFACDWKAEGTRIFSTLHSHTQETEFKSLGTACADGRQDVFLYHVHQCFYFACRAKNTFYFIL